MSTSPAPRVTVVLESRTPSFDEAAFVALRRSDAARASATVESFRFAPLREGSKGPELVSLFAHHEPVDLALSPSGTTVDAVATYALRNVVAGSRDGAETRGLLLGITDCSDPARLDEFQRWYDDHHASDVVRSGKYESAARYESADSPLGQFLALYRTSLGEPVAFRSYLAWPERDTTRCEVFVVRQVGTFERIG